MHVNTCVCVDTTLQCVWGGGGADDSKPCRLEE